MKYARLVTSKGFFNQKKKSIEPHLKPVEGEVRLFRTVLDKAVLDLLMEPQESGLWKDVYEWFFSPECEQDLILITNLAYLEVEDVRKKVKKLLDESL